MSIKEAIEDIFNLSSSDYQNREMDLDYITAEILDRIREFSEKGWTTETLRPRVSAAINNMLTKRVNGKLVENPDSILMKVKNGKGGHKRGVYKLRPPRKQKEVVAIRPVDPSLVSVANNLYVGSAGEMAVCSELLFRGYNVSRMMVDEGVDVVAIRNEKTYYIQVKTTTLKSNSFSVTIREKSFTKYCNNNCYYIIVIRTATKKNVPINHYLVLTADDIKMWLNTEKAKFSGDGILLSFSQKDKHIYLKDDLVDHKINNFNRIS